MTHTADCSGFEGVEKRVELSFSIAPTHPRGLRSLNRKIWDEVCSRCKCTILSHESTSNFDAYILSESSLFVFADKLMIKTCGTTQPLDGVEYIVTMARSMGMNPIDMTYSRSSFMFPDDQLHPHTSIAAELAYIDQMPVGKSVGKSSILGDVSGKYWLVHRREFENPAYLTVDTPDNRTVSDMGRCVLSTCSETIMVDVIMTGLDRGVARQYYKDHEDTDDGNKLRMAKSIIDNIPGFPRITGESFDPCGYSCNGVNDDRYMTVHITPEDAFSYASVEASFSKPKEPAQDAFRLGSGKEGGAGVSMKEISEFVNAVVTYFNPRDILVTMFSKDEGVSAKNISVGKKEKFMKPPCYYTSGNLLGEDIVASSVYYSGVSSGATGTKPTGLS